MKVAIVCTSNLSHDLSTWIHHHLEIIKINYIFLNLQAEEAPPYVKTHPRIFCVLDDSTFLGQQKRQVDFVNRCIRNHFQGIDFFLHIDDDELLVLNKKWASIQEYLSGLKWNDERYIRIQNYEAVLNHPARPAVPDYFRATVYFKDPYLDDFRGYKNGKSIGKASERLYCNGCHTFYGPYKIMDRSDGIILHFDCITFHDWFKKFQKLAAQPANGVYFDFYKESIGKVRHEKDQGKLKEFWFHHMSRCNHPIDISLHYKIN